MDPFGAAAAGGGEGEVNAPAGTSEDAPAAADEAISGSSEAAGAVDSTPAPAAAGSRDTAAVSAARFAAGDSARLLSVERGVDLAAASRLATRRIVYPLLSHADIEADLRSGRIEKTALASIRSLDAGRAGFGGWSARIKAVVGASILSLAGRVEQAAEAPVKAAYFVRPWLVVGALSLLRGDE